MSFKMKLGVDKAAYIKTGITRGGYVRDVTFENFKTGIIGTMITIRTDYGGSKSPVFPLPVIDNIKYQNMQGPVGRAGTFGCTSQIPCSNLILDEVHAETLLGWKCAGLENVTVRSVKPTFCTQ